MSTAMPSYSGYHIVVDLYDCHSTHLNNQPYLLTLLRQCAKQCGFQVVGEAVKQFEPQGITACLLLAESHISIHTWPDERYVSLDLYVCNHSRDNTTAARRGMEWLAEQFGPGHANIQSLQRGHVPVRQSVPEVICG